MAASTPKKKARTSKKAPDLFLFGPVTDESVKPLYEAIVGLKKGQKVTLHISSGGGECDAGRALVDAIERSPGCITTLGTGTVQSMAVDILLSGHKRQVTAGCMGMVHFAFWDGVDISPTTLPSTVRGVRLETERRMDLYRRRSAHHTDAELETHLFRHCDVWLTADEMATHGLADEVLR